MEWRLYIKHKLAFYHIRSIWRSRKGLTKPAICACGKKYGVFKTSWSVKARRVICFFRGHRWKKDKDTASAGYVGHTIETADVVWTMKQCSFCYKVKEVDSGIEHEDQTSSPSTRVGL